MAVRGLNATQLAEQIQRSKQQLSPYLNGKRIPDHAVIELLSVALECSAEDLMAENSAEAVDPRARRLEAIRLLLSADDATLKIVLDTLEGSANADAVRPAGKKRKPSAG